MSAPPPSPQPNPLSAAPLKPAPSSSKLSPAPAAAKRRQQAASGSFAGAVLRWTLLALATSALLSRAMTQTWVWGYEGKWTNPAKIRDALFPPKQLEMTEAQLALHDGSRPSEYPLYMAIDGDVYDISDGGMRNYGPGGPYHVFAGRDAARAFVTGCFKTHLTHDLRGLTPAQLGTVANWKKFYTNHAKYRRVGRVMHPPIDPDLPIPEPCDQGKPQPPAGGAKVV
ncbi:cytochrome b5-like heme/steroid binding domain-containing protein [Rhodotorula paludigena]|uniref:cytochrome b5-like heme/steroid binding domain-containing protein n=1 Tax=Rhodotorula paludigena TaxID=86838 RepID=UPI00317644D4